MVTYKNDYKVGVEIFYGEGGNVVSMSSFNFS
jgi:hypothetical protein